MFESLQTASDTLGIGFVALQSREGAVDARVVFIPSKNYFQNHCYNSEGVHPLLKSTTLNACHTFVIHGCTCSEKHLSMWELHNLGVGLYTVQEAVGLWGATGSRVVESWGKLIAYKHQPFPNTYRTLPRLASPTVLSPPLALMDWVP